MDVMLGGDSWEGCIGCGSCTDVCGVTDPKKVMMYTTAVRTPVPIPGCFRDTGYNLPPGEYPYGEPEYEESGLSLMPGCIVNAGYRYLENAAVSALKGRRECSDVGVKLEREIAVCRGDLTTAVDNAIGPVSRGMARAYRDILRCSERDSGDAGRLAMALGRQFHNSDNVRRDLEARLKSMKDMMSGTAVLFAPLVLGMSVSMLEPLSEISGYSQDGDVGAVLSLYLVELCLLIALLTSNLGSGDGVRSVVWRFCCTVPVALVVFRVCCGISL